MNAFERIYDNLCDESLEQTKKVSTVERLSGVLSKMNTSLTVF